MLTRRAQTSPNEAI